MPASSLVADACRPPHFPSHFRHMSDRLAELQRQRALLQAHLSWLDREIAAAAGKSSPAEGASSPTVAAPSLPNPAPAANAEELISRFGANPQDSIKSTRQGCFIVFALAFVILGLAVYAIYLYQH